MNVDLTSIETSKKTRTNVACGIGIDIWTEDLDVGLKTNEKSAIVKSSTFGQGSKLFQIFEFTKHVLDLILAPWNVWPQSQNCLSIAFR